MPSLVTKLWVGQDGDGRPLSRRCAFQRRRRTPVAVETDFACSEKSTNSPLLIISMLRIVTIKYVYDPARRMKVTMSLSMFSEVPAKPEYNPVRDAIEASKDRPDVLAALKLFSSMPQSTAVFANPVRHHHQITLDNTILE